MKAIEFAGGLICCDLCIYLEYLINCREIVKSAFKFYYTYIIDVNLCPGVEVPIVVVTRSKLYVVVLQLCS